MTLLMQVLLGTSLLVTSVLLHVTCVLGTVPVLRWVGQHLPPSGVLRAIGILSTSVLSLVFAHGCQIWLWATFFLVKGEFTSLDTSLYFSAVTYTTLGYGDIVLSDGIRLVATFASVAGLLSFGVSTAFFLAMLSRVLPKNLQER